MGYTVLNCPVCGATVQYSVDKDVLFCQFCGNQIVKDKKFIELSGKVSLSGVANIDSFLDRAFLFLEDRDFGSADLYLEKALDINPRCAKAYMGKLMCELRVPSFSHLKNFHTPLSNYSMYQKALRFATSEETALYKSINATIINCQNSLKNKEILSLKKDFKEKENIMYINQKDLTTAREKYARWTSVLVVSICFIAVFLVLSILLNILGPIMIALFLALLFISIYFRKKYSDAIIKCEEKEVEFLNLKKEITKKETEYNEWLNYNHLRIKK